MAGTIRPVAGLEQFFSADLGLAL